MSRARHKAEGGAVKSSKPPEYSSYGRGADFVKGIVKDMPVKKAGGGKVVGKAPGAKSKPRMDKRARGGRIATPTSPFSSASSPSPKSMA